MRNDKKHDLSKLTFVPTVVIIALITQIPFVVTIVFSFLRWNVKRPDLGISFGGLRNYIYIFTWPNFWRVLQPETADGRVERWHEERRTVLLGAYSLLDSALSAVSAPFSPADAAIPFSSESAGLGLTPARSRAVASMRQASQPRGLG